MTSDLFVWVYLPGESEPVVAGKLEIAPTAAKNIGYFTYGKSYLARTEAVPIDPVTLPLKKGEFTLIGLGGYPGALLDSCPDTWGIRVINRLIGKRVLPRGYLLLNDPGRAGCLAFSESPASLPTQLESREFPLADLLAAAEALENDEPVDTELLRALHPGTGGARPKCNIVENNAAWIAKFPSSDDKIISIPRLEHATMMLAKRCGIDAAETRLLAINGKEVCLVRRFDRSIENGVVYRKGFLSARTIFHADPAYINVGTGSYPRLARWMPRFGATGKDRKELFRRLVFNVAIRNDDDHELNHGLVHVGKDVFALSKAYDLVPSLDYRTVHHQALLIGDSAAGTIENLVTNCEAFSLDRDDALAIIRDVEQTVLDQWREVFYEAGFGDEDIRKVEHIFVRIPDSDGVDRNG